MYRIYRNCPKCNKMIARKEKGIFVCTVCGTKFKVAKDFKVTLQK